MTSGKVLFAALAALVVSLPQPAQANQTSTTMIAVVGAAAATVGVMAIFDDRENPTTTNPLASFGVGVFDGINNTDQDWATDLRVEYRFGNPFFYVVKPLIALQATTDGAGGAFAGLVADWVIGEHFVVAPSLAAGLWADGSGKKLGSTIQFRSQVEAGYRFDNDWRLTAAISHISNADLATSNPGVEIGTVYLHVPADKILPY